MPKENATVAVFDARAEAETAITELIRTGFDVRGLSLVGREPLNDTSWSGVPDMCAPPSPGAPPGSKAAGYACIGLTHLEVGEVFVAGALATRLVPVLENASLFGELSVLGAGLYTVGISQGGIRMCESALRSNRYLVVAHGSQDDVARAKQTLARFRRNRSSG